MRTRTSTFFVALLLVGSSGLLGAGDTTAPAASPSAVGSLDRAALAARVREEIRFAWQAYRTHAWGHDELQPLTRTVRDWYGSPLLMTPVDSLDTLLLAGLDAEAKEARELIVTRLRFDQDVSVQNFEITIRLLGGLLSGYEMTHDERLLRLADDLGKRLLPVFDSPTGMPYRFVNLRTGKTTGNVSNPAEIGTLILEWGTLSRWTHKPIYREKAEKALAALYSRRSPIGLVGEEIDVDTGRWQSPQSHVGGGIDSYYEYLLKCSRLFDDRACTGMWRTSKTALDRYLLDRAPSGLWYGQVDMNTGARTAREFGALNAFLPAVLALDGDLEHARALEDASFSMWTRFGLEPDLVDYTTWNVSGPRYPLRPEIIESAYYLHRLTGDPKYLAMGRTFFEDLVHYCRTDAGYTVIEDVRTHQQGNLMPSYFLAETLKYLYLLFAPDDKLSLDDVVFNTEAHAFRKAR